MSKTLTGLVLALWLGPLVARPALPQVAITGGEMTNLCTAAAKSGRRHPEAVQICTAGIEHEDLLGRDLAGLYVNRGVLRLREQDYRLALRDFDTALTIDPQLGEAWVDRGAGLIAEKRWIEGVANIDRGLTLGPEEPEKAYFNRAVAREHLADVKGAYLDYSKAVELAPDWLAPQAELQRFTVTRPAKP